MQTPHPPPTFATARDALFAQAGRLKGLLPEEEGRLIDDQVLGDLRANRFDIAVIGEIKAGKNTFLNALTRNPGLLPTEVTPWTAVITRMYFGHPERQQGGVFRFFTQEEWQAVTRPRGLRERVTRSVTRLLTRVVGGVQEAGDSPEEVELEKQCAEMEQQARRRLGDQLLRLLGQQHDLKEVSRAVLEEYLAAGSEWAENPQAGRYAGVTREAELFFPRVPFEEYCTVVGGGPVPLPSAIFPGLLCMLVFKIPEKSGVGNTADPPPSRGHAGFQRPQPGA
jgi:hypothetical protein